VSHSRTVLCIGSDAIGLRQRGAFLKEHGWRVLSSTKAHDAIVRFVSELVDAVVLDVDGDGAEAAVIAGELNRSRANVHVIMLVAEDQKLAEGVLDSADAVVIRSDQAELMRVLEAVT